MMNRKNIKNKLQTILDRPGVYKMLDEKGNILYIGKSIALKKRINSYLAKEIKRNNKIKQMLAWLWDVEVFYTDTELDALLLECKWIKAYRPLYNTALMQTERYGYLILEDGPHYRLRWSRTKPDTALRIIGPLTHPSLSRQAEEFFKSQYPFMDCKIQEEACAKVVFNKCQGYCKEAERKKRIEFIHELLSPGSSLPSMLMKQIETYSEKWEFEKAQQFYGYLKSINYIRGIEQMTNKLCSQNVIGRLSIEGTLFYKYYLIINGSILYTKVGMLYEENEIIQALRAYKNSQQEKEIFNIHKENIDEIKILYSFIERKMHRIEV